MAIDSQSLRQTAKYFVTVTIAGMYGRRHFHDLGPVPDRRQIERMIDRVNTVAKIWRRCSPLRS
jgi:hypothetical protein